MDTFMSKEMDGRVPRAQAGWLSFQQTELGKVFDLGTRRRPKLVSWPPSIKY